MEHFRSDEIFRLRQEEKSQYDDLLAQMRREFEAKEEARKVKQQSELDSHLEQLRKKESELTREYSDQRQKVLEEYEIARLKSEAINKQAELNDKSLALKFDEAERKMDEATIKVMELDDWKAEYCQKLKDEKMRYEMDFDKQHTEILSSLNLEKSRLETERAVLEERSKHISYLSEQLTSLQKEIHVVKEMYHHSAEELSVTRKENEMVKQQLQQQSVLNEVLQSQVSPTLDSCLGVRCVPSHVVNR
jgi:hypothetical protein